MSFCRILNCLSLELRFTKHLVDQCRTAALNVEPASASSTLLRRPAHCIHCKVNDIANNQAEPAQSSCFHRITRTTRVQRYRTRLQQSLNAMSFLIYQKNSTRISKKRRRNGSQNPPTCISCSSYMTEDYFMCQQCSLRRMVHILTIEMQMQDLSVKHIDFDVVASTCGMQHSYDRDRER